MIRVGTEPDLEDFVAHESFLISRSEFFRRALNGNWKEAETRIVKLPDEAPDIFGLYLNLVYTGHVHTAHKSQEDLMALDEDEFVGIICKEYWKLVKVYVLAESLQDVAARNAVVIAMLDLARVRYSDGVGVVPSSGAASFGYAGTPESSPLRRLLVDLICGRPLQDIIVDLHGGDQHGGRLNKEFVVDLATKVQEIYIMDKEWQTPEQLTETLKEYIL
jgi:hypothetical protein